MPTRFALERLMVRTWDLYEHIFWFDGNGKITVGNGTFSVPRANAFSLVQVEDCPSATSICKEVCYVHRLEKNEATVHRHYRENSKKIREILKDTMYQYTVRDAFAGWIQTNAPLGFRWHVSGDIFSLEYAWFIRSVCLKARPVPNWLYTRSFQYLGPLADVRNLVVNLSADKDNFESALEAHKKYGFRLCYLTVEGEIPHHLPKHSVIFPSHALRGIKLLQPTDAPWWKSLSQEQRRMVCPPDFFGQSEKMRCGPCNKCLTKKAALF